MKILSYGNPPTPYWCGRFRCTNCGTILQIERDDEPQILERHNDQRDGVGIKLLCPVCRTKAWFSPSAGTILDEYWGPG